MHLKRTTKNSGSISIETHKLPEFMIIGVQKGGTSSLFHYLSQHPQTLLSEVKEIHYYDLYFEKGAKWYKSHFYNKKHTITGEASPYYIFHPLVAKRVHEQNPKVKLIVMLRNPLARAYSHYQMERKRGYESADSFEKAIEAERKTIDMESALIKKGIVKISKKHLVSSYLSRGAYAKQLKEWFKYFKKDQFLFIKSEDFFRSPVSVLNEVTAFLGIRSFIPDDLTPKNTSSYDTINADTRKYLENYFKKNSEELKALIGDKFIWAYNE